MNGDGGIPRHSIPAERPPYPEALPFASLAIYISKAKSLTKVGNRCRAWAIAAKNNNIRPDWKVNPQPVRAVDALAQVLAGKLAASTTDVPTRFFGPDVWLVPMPRATLMVKDALWPTLKLAEAMHAQGIGAGVWPGLVRAQPIRSSSRSPGDRPEPWEHYLTMQVHLGLPQQGRFLLVDDVLTRGSTHAGAAALLASAGVPFDRLLAFAMFRTVQQEPDFLVQPTTGTITVDEWQTPHVNC